MSLDERRNLHLFERFKQFCVDWPTFTIWSAFMFALGVLLTLFVEHPFY